MSSNSALLSCVRLLRQRYQCVFAETEGAESSSDHDNNLVTLRLAESFLEKSAMVSADASVPVQIAVIGPTQSGKSTLVNYIVGQAVARVSPMAGYTVHPQGFALAENGEWTARVAEYFRDFERVQSADLPADHYGFFVLETGIASTEASLAEAVIWDTPDFDSVSAHDYVIGVLRVVALADVVVLVVSKDKYADQSVWETMALIEPLGQPTVVCLNKIDPEVGPTLERSLSERWRESRRSAVPTIVSLPYATPSDFDAREHFLSRRHILMDAIEQARANVRRGALRDVELGLVRRHWSAWTAPVRREQEALEGWATSIELIVAEAVTIYRRDYLDHPQHYETFQRALAELLTLLELPGVGTAMLIARKIVTWPIRQLGRLGKGKDYGRGVDQENVVLAGIIEHMLLRANELALANCNEDGALRAWWSELAASVRRRRVQGREDVAVAIENYRWGFQPHIERTAMQLMEGLKQHPAALNSLRAARFTTDAIALAMALHSGGIGVQDFVIAPAILAVTSLMAEGVLGRYMLRAEQDLKRQQLQAVEVLLRETIGDALKRLPLSIADNRRFNVPAELLVDIERLWR